MAKLRIDGDVSPLKKSLMDLSKVVQNGIGKSKIDVVSPEMRKFFQKEGLTQMNAIKTAMDRINESAKRQAEKIKEAAGNAKKELEAKQKLMEIYKNLNAQAKQYADMQKLTEVGQERTFGYQFKQKSGLGKLQSSYQEQGMSGLAGGLAARAGIAALIYAGARVYQSRETYAKGIPTRVNLMGRGVSDLELSDPNRAAGAGLNASTMREARMRDLDVFGSAGASQRAVTNRARFERNFGMGEGTLSDIGGQFRPMLGGKGAETTVMKLQASLIASGIKDAIGPYLEASTNLLSSINEKGFTKDESLLASFNQLLKAGEGEGRTGKLMSGLDSAMRGSSGEANAFFQDVMRGAGVGGGTIGGARAALQMGGLFGADLDKYKFMSPQSRKIFEGLGMGSADYTQKVSGSLLKHLDAIGNQSTIDKLLNSTDPRKQQQGRDMGLQRLMFLQSVSHASNAGEAAEYEGIARQLSNPKLSREERSKLEARASEIERGTPELVNLEKINKSTEGTKQVLDAILFNIEEQMGKKTGDTYNQINRAKVAADSAISDVTGVATGTQKMNWTIPSGMSLGPMFPVNTKPQEANAPGYAPKSNHEATIVQQNKTLIDQHKQSNTFLSELLKNTKEKGRIKPGTPNTTGH